jgi:hypothetical protein
MGSNFFESNREVKITYEPSFAGAVLTNINRKFEAVDIR